MEQTIHIYDLLCLIAIIVAVFVFLAYLDPWKLIK